MSGNKIKQITALLLTFSILLCANGDWYRVFASSVSTDTSSEETEVSNQGEKADDSTSNPEQALSDSDTDQSDDTKTDTDQDNQDKNNAEKETDASTTVKSQSSLLSVTAETPVVLDGETDGTSEKGIELPVTDGSVGSLVKGQIYIISSYEQWNALSKYSKDNDLEGYKFRYNARNENGQLFYDYDLSSQGEFQGLGSEAYPFAGELSSNFEVDNITLKLNKPLFTYLSSKAKINKNKIESTSSSRAGIAEHLVVKEDATLNYENITVIGTVGSSTMTGQVGGLFANVTVSPGTKLTLQGNNVSVSASVTGETAGGLIGKLNGSAAIHLGGIDFSIAKVNGITTNISNNEKKCGQGCVGGIIGSVVGNSSESTKSTLELTNAGDAEFVYNRIYECAGDNEYCGGFFGRIQNTTVHVSCPMTYIGDENLQTAGLKGFNVGAFAGEIDNSSVVLHRQVLCQDVKLARPSYKNFSNFDWKEHGVGLFVGTLRESKISVASDFTSSGTSTDAIIIKTSKSYGSYDDKKYNIKINDKDTWIANFTNFGKTSPSDTEYLESTYNVGFLIGLCYDSNVTFTSAHKCKIYSNKFDFTFGNAGGAIGRMVAENKDCSLNYVEIPEKNQINLMNRSDYSGGLVGQAYVAGNKDILISYCDFNGYFRFTQTTYAKVPSAVGVVAGGVTSAKDVDGKFILDNIKTSLEIQYSGDSKLDSFGGVIGEMNANFEIKNSSFIATKVENYGNNVKYVGGLIGLVNNGGNRIHGEVIGSASNDSPMMISMPFTSGKVSDAYGSFFGYVGKNTAISLSGNISQEGQKINLNNYNPANAGSIVGYQDDALIFMEQGTILTKSSNYEFDEIGNYGGVIRNSDIDGDGHKLIENFQVTGTLKNELATTEDLLRLAIALNTEGSFMPDAQLQGESLSSLSKIEQINSASYTLTGTEYDLTNTGISCLNRNDEKGIKTPFKGSLKGQNTATIRFGNTEADKDNANIHNQPYQGLFSAIDGGTAGSNFENLNLQFRFKYNSQVFSNSASKKAPKKENFGGLAAVSKGNILLKNITYQASVTDSSNTEYYSENKGFRQYKSTTETIKENDYDCIGGLLGRYIGTNESTLTIGKINADGLQLTCSDYTHVVGGMIGYVDLTALGKGQTCHITLGTETDSVSLSGNITVSNMNFANTNGETFPIRTGGLIARIGNITRSNLYDPKCHLSIYNLNMDGFTLNEKVSLTSDSEIGGLWGWKWTDVDVSLHGGTIGASQPTGLSVNTSFGGLVHTVSGKMQLQNLTIGEKTSMDAQNLSVEKCGLLVQDGQYLYLDVQDYNIVDHDAILTSNKNTDFDELVGITKGGDDSEHGGIVSIGKVDSNKFYLGRKNAQEYESFASSHVTNPNTRYYYDLNKLSWSDGASRNEDLNSADDIMRWHLLHYANAYLLSALDSQYSVQSGLPKEYTIGGTDESPIDLTGYSLYPTPVNGETYTRGVIKLDAQSIITGESNISDEKGKYPDKPDSQNYQMQTGLFANVTGLSVSNLKITGSYSQSDSFAGALVSGKIKGVPLTDASGNIVTDASGKTQYDDKVINAFENIEISNLWCVSSNSTFNYDAPIGLLIADISSGAQVSFDTIKMTDYKDSDVTDGKKAASALIGNVGGETATYISMSFINMDIADAAKPHDSVSTAKDQSLAKASFIYRYEYADNCNGIYTFTYEDYIHGRCISPNTKYVTLGNELGDGGEDTHYAIEEYFDIDSPVGQLKSADNSITFKFLCSNYIPYVCNGTKKILVNPKTGHLDKGCGTYEDPYIISSTRQLISLYRYLYEEDKFQSIFINGKWKVNPVGSDDKLCDGTIAGHGEAEIYQEAPNESFPTKEQLSRAYYLISKDIDLSDYPEFTGFGTTKLPFTGVFVGDYSKSDPSEKPQDSTYPKITMPKIPSESAMADFGFVKFSKGCVVRNLVIEFPQVVSINQETTVKTEEGEETQINRGGVGGGVIATVLGGENIIDNVQVTGTCFKPLNAEAEIGGYVGRVNAGGLILRNMRSGVLENFKVEESEGVDYRYTCGIVGRVLDGYVVYDGDTNNTDPLFTFAGSSGTSTLTGTDGNPLQLEWSLSYDILNGSYLKAGLTDKSISWDSTNGFGNISNAKQLQVLSMALNAGLLNYNANEHYLYDGYNEDSRQRSGDYHYVGEVEVSNQSSSSYNAWKQVAKYDNNNKLTEGTEYHSYLSDFFAWSSMLTDGQSQDLNPYDKATSFTLTGADAYDMTVYKTAFRGLGGRYFDQNYQSDGKKKANVFHGKLTGPEGNATILLNMLVDGSQNAEYAALLNNIVKPAGDSWKVAISNISISGAVINTSKLLSDTNTDSIKVSTTPDGTKNAAALISDLSNVELKVNNVLLNSINVQSEHYAGGMIAVCDGSSGNVVFNTCGITGTEESVSNVKGCTDTGGFIGYSGIEVTISPISKLEYMDVECIADSSSEERKNAGGLIGTLDRNFTICGSVSDNESTKPDPLVGNHITVKTTGDKDNVQIGGLVGRATGTKQTYAISNMTLKNLTVENSFNGTYATQSNDETKWIIATGGIIGAVDGNTTIENVMVGSRKNTDHVSIQNTSDAIPNHDFYGTGGMVGRHISGATMHMTNCHVLGAITDGNTYSTQIKGRGKYVGGMVGNSRTFTGNALSVEGVSIDAGRYAGGMIGWVQNKNVLSNVNVKNVSIQLNGEYDNNNRGDLGGIIGYSQGAIDLTDISVDSIMIASDYCNNAGGFIGRMVGNNSVSIKTVKEKENSVKNSVISGQNAGGIFGKIIYNNNCCNIKVSNNKIISCREDGSYSTNSTDIVGPYSDGTAGGFAGCLNTNTWTDLFVNQLTIEKNLISAYSTSNNKYAALGGVSGYVKSRFVFFDVTLSDNAIGIMKVNTGETGDDLPQKLSDRSASLASNSIDILKGYLYFMMNTGSTQFSESKIKDTSVNEKDFYKYSYRQGAFIGSADSESQKIITKFINARVIYQEPKYRPVADVGAGSKLDSNDAMYDNYRSNCVIIYDGKVGETPDTPSIRDSLLKGTPDELALTFNVPYVFNNLQSIMEEYTGSDTDRRMAYRLGDNYQKCEAVDRGTASEPDKNKNKSVEQVYQNTFINDQGYCSPYLASDGTTIPMIVYRSSQNGTLDEVIQTYINIFTNNSGGLNSYVNTYHERTLSVETFAMQVKDGVVSQNTTPDAQSSVQKKKVTSISNTINNTVYSFDAPDGDDFTDSKNGSFTLIRIVYGWKDSSTTVSWTLDLPVYVEKRLKVTSNMKMLQGICYNTTKLKNDGNHVLKEDAQKSPMILSKGSSYSIYAEYVYENSEKFSSVEIPKSVYIDTDAKIYFTAGTKLTLIPLDEGARAYYYEVPESAATEMPKEIEFTKFKNADNTSYVTQDITQKADQKDYVDLCNTTHEGNSRVERFVLLVDTSHAAGISDSGDTPVSSTGSNKGYDMNVKPSSVFKDDIALYSRTEHTDHCYGSILEIEGASYKINTSRNSDNTNSKTYLKASSSISEDGKVGVHLQYDVTADTTYWGTVKNTEPKYLDIGFSLAYKADTNGSLVKIPLPSGTTVTLGAGNDKVSLPATGKQSTAYYYQSLRQSGKTGEDSYVKINDHNTNFSSQIDCSFDFSGANLSELDAYSGGKFYVMAQLVVMGDKDLPAAGDILDKWEASVEAELKSDFGFALNVKNLTTLGMNQYSPEESDSGVVSYTASIAFPENNQDKLDSKYYTIIYQIEEKTSSNTGGKPVYQPYTGENVSLLLGEFNNSNAAKSAAEADPSSESSGKGIVAATYQFSTQQISEGAELIDGKNASGSDKTAGVVKTHCTLVANCEGLDMTNYRVKAYLMVTDSVPTLTTSGNVSSNESESTASTTLSGTASSDGCLKHYWLREGNWPTISDSVLTSDLKSDYFVFTVAKIKTTM